MVRNDMDEQTDVSLQVVALALPDGCAFIVATLFLPTPPQVLALRRREEC